MKLYELSDDYKSLVKALDSDETLKDDIAPLLADIKGRFDDKAVSIAKLTLSINADIETIKLEITRLSKRSTALDNKASWLKEYLLKEMQTANIDKVEGDVLTVSLRKNPASVNVINEKAIPKEYMVNIPESWQPDKKKILSLLKNDKYTLVAETKQIINKDTGEIIDGFEIINDKKHLEIK
jgi:archaellum component FlaC